MTCLPFLRYTLKSRSSVSTVLCALSSAIRTRQASATDIGTSAYLRINAPTLRLCSSKRNGVLRTPRASISSTGVPPVGV